MTNFRFVLIVLLVNCGPAEPSLLVESPDETWEARRRRMNVRVNDAQTNTVVDKDPADFLADIQTECQSTLEQGGSQGVCLWTLYGNPPTKASDSYFGGDCLENACVALLRTCVAHRLLETARPAAPTQIGSLTVPPQSREARTGMAEMASLVAREAILTTGEALRAAAGLSSQALPEQQIRPRCSHSGRSPKDHFHWAGVF